MTIFKFDLGDTLRDTVTKFEGVAMARTQWFNGCLRYQLQPPKLKDGKMLDQEVFDEQQLVLVKAAKKPEAKKLTGGPQKDVRSPTRELLR